MFYKSKSKSKSKSKNIKRIKKKTNKLHGGGNSANITSNPLKFPVCKSITDLPMPIKLANILLQSNSCAIKSLITFQGITLKVKISINNIIFKLGKNEDMYCITLSFKKNNSKLEDYFLNNDKSLCTVELQKN